MNYHSLIVKYLLYKQYGGNRKWSTLHHNGVMFPSKYIVHGIPVIYESKKIVLRNMPDAEEAATAYAKYFETEYIKNKTFNRNFWKDWKKILGKNHTIQSLEKCDFSLINKFIIKKKEIKKNVTKEQKKKQKEQKDILEEKYKYAIVDGVKQQVGNFRIEIFGIFIGRGCHPKLGRIKKKNYPEDVTLNLSRDAPIPKTLPGHKWGEIVHYNQVEWLASWKDPISFKTKYMWLGSHSNLQAISDMKKFELARKLKKKIKKLKSQNEINLDNSNNKIKQIATSLYFIDSLALRVGNEKGADTADTFGVISLRYEHITLLDNTKIKLDFLGKDAIRYEKIVKVPEKIYRNIKIFLKSKQKGDQLFDLIDPNDLNKYLQKFMKGLTAKVFRTYNASYLFQKELHSVNNKYKNNNDANKKDMLLDEFNKANAKVALLCNHQKKVSKSFNIQIKKMNDQIKKLQKKLRKIKKNKKTEERRQKIKQKIKKLKLKKILKSELKNISLGTSKVNYIDPRIVVAFMKKHEISIDKVFSKNLQNKFKWAFKVDSDFKF